MLNPVRSLLSLFSRVEEWFFIARLRFGLWFVGFYQMDDLFKELREAFEGFLSADKEHDEAVAVASEKAEAVAQASRDLDDADEVVAARAEAKKAARDRVEELMNATD